jgi:hypothetical protein
MGSIDPPQNPVPIPEPPESDHAVAGFPSFDLEPDADIWRVVRTDRSSWWFGNNRKNRFDLPAPKGTCYTAEDRWGAVAESIVAPGQHDGVVAEQFVLDRRITRLSVPTTHRLADTTDRSALGYGLTNELGVVHDRSRTQAWAATFHNAGFEGIRNLLRADPGRSTGQALFGEAGARSGWDQGERQPITEALLEDIESTFGIRVQRTPLARELTLVDEPEH